MLEIETKASPLGKINPTEYTISIGSRPGGFCFSLYTPKRHGYEGLYEVHTTNVETALKAISELGIELGEFRHIYVLDDCKKWTLLPTNLKGIDQTALWKLNFGVESQNSIERTNITAANAICLYEPSDTSLQLKEHLANATIVPLAATDIDNVLKASLKAQGKYIGIDIRNKRTNLYIANKGQLELANTYNTECEADALYFIMNAIRTFQLDQTLTRAELWGYATESLLKQMKLYLKDASTVQLEEGSLLIGELKKLKNKHEYFELIHPSICEL